MPTLLSEAEGHTASGAHGEPLVDPAQSETLTGMPSELASSRIAAPAWCLRYT
jgi:hypothetical protein